MIQIREEQSLELLVQILEQIPEFTGGFSTEYLQQRLDASPIALVAWKGNKAIACKMGYDRYSDGSFYSWLGGVLPEYRNEGIAGLLNQHMERLAKEKGFSSLVFKTRNKFKAMLQFGLKNGYSIVDFEKKDTISEYRIVLQKTL